MCRQRVRRGVLRVQRRVGAAEVADGLGDREPAILAEAVRAIHDLPIAAALPQVAALSSCVATLATAPRRRVLNARFRLGHTENVDALVEVAADAGVTPILRREALALLAGVA